MQHRHRKIAVFFCDDDFFAFSRLCMHTSGEFLPFLARGLRFFFHFELKMAHLGPV